MSAVDELIAFVRQQLAEDERVVRQMLAEPAGFYLEAETENVNIMTVGAYVQRWQPKRVLAEVEAKRRVLDECDKRWHAEDPNYDVRRTDDNWGDALAFAVKLLAQPYAGREGWREEWSA